MRIQKIYEILNFLNIDDQNLISAKVEFKNPNSGKIEKIDLKTDGFYILEQNSLKTDDFQRLSTIMTEHYYDSYDRDKDDHYLLHGNLLSVDETEFEIKIMDNI